MKPGRFLSLEGVEGAGKSTNLVFVVDYLQARGIDIVETREPGGTPLGESLRDLLLDPRTRLSARTELLLMYASRLELVEQIIRPALTRGAWVVSDRFADASFAYQGGGRQLGFEQVASLHQWVLGDFEPHCTLYLDLPVEISLERVAARGESDRFEKEQQVFFEAVRDGYRRRLQQSPVRFHAIDATESLSSVQRAISRVLDQQIQDWEDRA